MKIAVRTAALLLLTINVLNAAPAHTERPGWLGLGLQYEPGAAGQPGSFHVRHVLAGSPAGVAGLKPQDLIVSVNGKAPRYKDKLEAVRAFSSVRPGDRLKLVIVRSGRKHSVTVTAAVMPDAYYEMWKNNEAAAKAKSPRQ